MTSSPTAPEPPFLRRRVADLDHHHTFGGCAIFVALAEELHLGRAAARERISQSSLNQQLQRLERELDVVLLILHVVQDQLLASVDLVVQAGVLLRAVFVRADRGRDGVAAVGGSAVTVSVVAVVAGDPPSRPRPRRGARELSRGIGWLEPPTPVQD